MNTEAKTVELEIVSPDDKLVKYARQTGLETTATSSLVSAFQPIFAKARAALADAQGVAESVKDATCVKEIRKSRACRLALRKLQVPKFSTKAFDLLPGKIETLAKWIESQIKTGELL